MKKILTNVNCFFYSFRHESYLDDKVDYNETLVFSDDEDDDDVATSNNTVNNKPSDEDFTAVW